MTSAACPEHDAGIHTSYCPQSDAERYPECRKLTRIRNDKAVLLCFMNWLEENELTINDCNGPVMKSDDKLLMEYFGVDENKLEKERRAILEEQRKLNEKG